jgi:N-acetylneuraminic acid mutarotase
MKPALKFTVALFALLLTSNAFVSVFPPENTWLNKSSMPQSDYGLRAASVDGKIYVIGGSINLQYDPASDSWATRTAMPTPRNWFSIAIYEGKIYTFGGIYGQAACNAGQVYDPKTDTWASLAPMPVNASSIDANRINGKIYLIGLPDSRASLTVNLVYDVVTDSWTNKTTMPIPVNAYTSAVLDSKIYVFGGFDAMQGTTRSSNQTQMYDPYVDRWTLGSPIPGPVLGITACATTGTSAPKRIYVLGGLNGIDGVNTTQVYNPTNDSWSFGSLMPTARAYPVLSAVDDQIYVFGGSAYAVFSPVITATQEYTPYEYGELTSQSPKPRTPLTPAPESLFFPIALAVVAVATCGSIFYFKKKSELGKL